MQELTLIQDLAIVMAVSAAATILCHRLHLPAVLGYIVAGFIIGPHTPPYALVTDTHSIQTLAELGIVFLLFSIGLEFSLSKLFKVGLVSIFAATFEILLMIAIGYTAGRAFGWSAVDSLFLGAILSISSTTIIAKILLEMKKVGERFAQVILGILIVEDLLAIVIIAILSGLAKTGTLSFTEAGGAMFQVCGFIAGVLLAGFLIVPRLMGYLARLKSKEMMTVAVLGLCFGVSLLASKLGFSVALGAFLIGAVIAETKEHKAVIQLIEPIRDMFTAVFFVAVGMLLQPSIVEQFAGPILIITLVTIAGKIFSCSLATFLAGYKPDTALMVGLGLAQIGEFSFIIARMGESTGVSSSFLYPIAVSISGITTLTTPLLMRSGPAIVDKLKNVTPGPVATFLGLYTSWMEKLLKGETQSERQQAAWNSIRLYGYRLLLCGIGLAGVIYGFSFLQKRIAFLSPIVVPSFAAVAILAVLAALVAFWWGSITKLHDRIEKTIIGLLEEKAAPQTEKERQAHEALARLIREEYPWAVETTDFLLPFNESAVNQPIKDLRLRGETGASIVAVYRDPEPILNPPADTKLLPGDVLLLMGDADQIKAAVAYLSVKTKQPPPQAKREGTPKTQRLEIPSDSKHLGRSIAELKLRRKCGVTILGIQKGDNVTNNPSGEIVLEEGDVLMLFGWPDELETAARYLSEKARPR
jgi:CPA2 family monovalent cation:H+ antiporter-2